MSEPELTPTIVEWQRRRAVSQADWMRHFGAALVPFLIFMYGVTKNSMPASIVGFAGFVAIGGRGAYRMMRARRCPACGSFQPPGIRLPYRTCDDCGTRLSMGVKDST